MNHDEKPKIGAPKKALTKKKISITLDDSDIESAKTMVAGTGESVSSLIGRAIQLMLEKQNERGPKGRNRGGRSLNPNDSNSLSA